MKKIIAAVALAAAIVPAAASTASAHSVYSPDRYCGQAPKGLGILANRVTTCAFARDVAGSRPDQGYYGTVHVYSRAVKRTITMRARMARWPGPDANPYLRITGGRGAVVKVVS